MFIEKRKITREDIQKSTIRVNIFLVLLFVVLLFSFWSKQVLKHDYYTTQASQNIRKYMGIKAPRGLIRDRNRKILSENKLNFSLFLIRENTKDISKSIDIAASITGQERDDIAKRVEKYRNYPEFYMIPVEKNLPLEKAIYIESRSDELPEFKIETEPARTYPYGKIASHVLGYLSELTPEELKREKDEGLKLGDLTGKSGIEKQYGKYLRGQDGFQTVTKDHLGMIQEKLGVRKPVIGDCVELTIDIELQEYIEELLKDHRGTVGVVDLSDGGLLALVSKPNFSPEFFSGSFGRKEWLALINDPDKPLHNKFTQGQYSPGSVFKIVMSLTCLEEKIINTTTTSYCSGTVEIYGDIRHCWKKSGHGSINIYDAIKNSCNIFFYRLGKKVDIDTIEYYARQLGLGESSGIDLPNENLGVVPSSEWKLKNRGEKWYPGDTISVAIGHGMIDVTPAQILVMISTVALRGRRPTLHLLQRVERNGETVLAYQPHFTQVKIKKETFETVIEGLYRVVNAGGTAWAGSIKGLDICGKTGTGQIISKENPNYDELAKQDRFRPHSWFASFAPRNNPRYAMVVFIENGGDAGSIAAPIAKKIYLELFKDKK